MFQQMVKINGYSSRVQGVPERAAAIMGDRTMAFWIEKMAELPLGHTPRVETIHLKEVRETTLQVYALFIRIQGDLESGEGQQVTPYKVTVAIGSENLKAMNRRTVAAVREAAPLTKICKSMLTEGCDPEKGKFGKADVVFNSQGKREVVREDPEPKRQATGGGGGGGTKCLKCNAMGHKQDWFGCLPTVCHC